MGVDEIYFVQSRAKPTKREDEVTARLAWRTVSQENSYDLACAMRQCIEESGALSRVNRLSDFLDDEEASRAVDEAKRSENDDYVRDIHERARRRIRV